MNEEYVDEIKMAVENLKNMKYLKYIKDKLSKYRYICIFGLGNVGKELHEELLKRNIQVDFFCDNNYEKVGSIYKNTKCISVDELIKIKEETLVLIATVYYKEIYEQLNLMEVPNIDRFFANKLILEEKISRKDISKIYENINALMNILSDDISKRIVLRLIEEWGKDSYIHGQIDDIHYKDQYFPKDLVELSNEEIFVDAGAYIGDTIDDFLIKTKYQFQKIYSFELNKDIYLNLEENIKKYDKKISQKIYPFNIGISDKNQNCAYNDLGAGSSIDDKGQCNSKTIRLDDILNRARVTFIKMDIEGSELEALKGSYEIINNWRPNLAISIYHKMEDMWDIPLYLNSLNLGYKIYIRHHTDCLTETVCYAIRDK